jgi:hypothetical protein
MWYLWWTNWHWDRIFSEFFGFALSVSFHRGSPHSYIIWRWTVGPLVVAVQIHSLTPSTLTTWMFTVFQFACGFFANRNVLLLCHRWLLKVSCSYFLEHKSFFLNPFHLVRLDDRLIKAGDVFLCLVTWMIRPTCGPDPRSYCYLSIPVKLFPFGSEWFFCVHLLKSKYGAFTNNSQFFVHMNLRSFAQFYLTQIECVNGRSWLTVRPSVFFHLQNCLTKVC